MKLGIGQSGLRQWAAWLLTRRLLVLLIWFLLAFAGIHWVDAARGANFVIRVDAPQNGTLQVFFPDRREPFFKEELSERRDYLKGAGQVLVYGMTRLPIDEIRVDPFESNGEVLIKSIEVNTLFSRSILSPTQIDARISAAQDLEKQLVSGERLLLKSRGKDPSALVSLAGLAFETNYLSYAVSLIFIALGGFALVGAPLHPSLKRKLYVLLLPLFLSVVVVNIFYPGYMTYDTLHALRAARNGVVESAWPPMVSYIWRAVDAVDSHPSAMFFSQVFVLLLATSILCFYASRTPLLFPVAALIILSVPVVLGTVSAIWKDVLMASLLLASFASILLTSRAHGIARIAVLLSVSFPLLLLGIATRHNAIVAALPIIAVLAWSIANAIQPQRKSITALALFVVTIMISASVKTSLDAYSLPSLQPIVGSNTLVTVVRKMDIAGASLCAKQNLFEQIAPSLTMKDIATGYDPRHSNLSVPLLDKIPDSSGVNGAWLSALRRHPACFFSNKVMLAKYLLGANAGEQFLIASPQVDPNEYGYYLPVSHLRARFEAYILNASRWFFFRPWFLWSALLGVTIYVARMHRRLGLVPLVLISSGALYAVGLFVFGNAADARLLFYSNYVFCLALLILCFEIVRGHWRQGSVVNRSLPRGSVL